MGCTVTGVIDYALCLIAVTVGALCGVAIRVLLAYASVGGRVQILSDDVYVLPNMIGCFVMGLSKALVPLQKNCPKFAIAVATGFCGCLTTLSSWVVAVTDSATADIAVARVAVGLTLPLVCVAVGMDVGSSLSDIAIPHKGDESNEPSSESHDVTESSLCPSTRLIDAALVGCTAVAAFVVLLVNGLESTPPGMATQLWISSLLGPPGAILRYVLGVEGKRVHSWFPVGTLAANVLACVVLAALHRCRVVNKDAWCDYVVVGFCGSLSTVSSWAFETLSLRSSGRRWCANGYCLGTVAVCIGICIGPSIIDKP